MEKMKRCSVKGCSGEYEKKTISHAVKHGGKTLILENVPAAICPVCGDTLLAVETVEAIEKMLSGLEEGNLPNSMPWREAFPEYIDKDLPSVCLRAARRREGLTQKELAVLSGISKTHISLMERGKMPIDKARAKRLAKALNVGYEVFL